LLFFIFTFLKKKKSIPWIIKKKVSIINSVIFLFELELKQLKLSKILPMWKIGVYMVLELLFKLPHLLIIILLVIFFYLNVRKIDIDIYFKSLMA